MKRFGIFFLLCLMLLPSAAIASGGPSASGEASGASGEASGEGITWLFDTKTGTLYISGTGDMNSLYARTAPWNGYFMDIRAVVISAGITTVGDFAFQDCLNLTEVTLPDSIVSIGECAFDECENLPRIDLPEGLESIGDYAFNGCRRLAEVTMPDGVTVGTDAFYECPFAE